MNLRINYKEPVKEEVLTTKPGLLMNVFYMSFACDDEEGWISSWNEKFIFVRFKTAVDRLPWDQVTSQSCRPEDLYHIDCYGKKRYLKL